MFRSLLQSQRVNPPEDEQEPSPTPPPHQTGTSQPDITVETLFRVTRAFLVPFLFSWMLAYVGGERGIEWIYYLGLGGVGVSVVGLLLWLLHH